MKLRKKIVVKKRIGPNCEKNEGLSELGDFMFLVCAHPEMRSFSQDQEK